MKLVLLTALLPLLACGSILPVSISGLIQQGGANVTGDNLVMQGPNYQDFLSGGMLYPRPLPALGSTLEYDAFSPNCPSMAGCSSISIDGQVGWIGELSLHTTPDGWLGTYSVFAGVQGSPNSFQLVAREDVITDIAQFFGTAINGQQGITGYILSAPSAPSDPPALSVAPVPEPSTWLMMACGLCFVYRRKLQAT